MHRSCATALAACLWLASVNAQTLRQAGAMRALLMGAAADANEFGEPNPLVVEPLYASTLGAQYSMLEPENAMKWGAIHPASSTYDFGPGDLLVSFAGMHGMKVRGHNLAWGIFNPDWLNTLAQTATPGQMASTLQDHITKVVSHYKGQVFAWDVVNEAIKDDGSGMKDSIWFDQPGIGATGKDWAFIEQAFQWAHAADPGALLFYNDYNIEDAGAKFDYLYAMVQDMRQQGVPIGGVGIQMHVTIPSQNSGVPYPTKSGLEGNIRKLTDLGLQVHITEMDVRIPVDANGNAASADLQAQAQMYQEVLSVCLEFPLCTGFQTWGFTDKHSWIPSSYPGFGAALPFDVNYQAKPAVQAMLDTLATAPPVLNADAVVNAASYAHGAIAPGELVTIFQANFGPATLTALQLGANNIVTSNLAGTRVLFDGKAAPVIYTLAGQSTVVAPYRLAGQTSTQVQYVFNGFVSNVVTVPVAQSAPGLFATDATGQGPGAILNHDSKPNSSGNPAAAGTVIQVFATGGGMVKNGAIDGQLAPGPGAQQLAVTAAVGGKSATVQYAGPAPGEVNGVMQVNVVVPPAAGSGALPVVISVNNTPSQSGITVAVKGAAGPI